MNDYIVIYETSEVLTWFRCLAKSYNDAAKQCHLYWPDAEIEHIEQTSSVEEAYAEFHRMLV